MNAFWTLVKNDLKISRNRRVSRQWRAWRWFYFGLILAAGFVTYTVVLVNGLYQPEFMYYGIPSMFMSFLMFLTLFSAISTIKQEWRADTVGWWLSLPYSRAYLLGAKFIASLLRALKAALALALIPFVFWLAGVILRPDIWRNFSLGILYVRIAELYGMFLLICPLIITLGIFLSVIGKSKLRPVMPLIWIIFMAIFSTLFTWNTPWGWGVNILNNSGLMTLFPSIWFNIIPGILFKIIAPLLFAGMIFWGAVYLLKRQVEL